MHCCQDITLGVIKIIQVWYEYIRAPHRYLWCTISGYLSAGDCGRFVANHVLLHGEATMP